MQTSKSNVVERQRERERNRATEMCERVWVIVKGDVNGGERVRIGENDMGKMGHYDERERGGPVAFEV